MSIKNFTRKLTALILLAVMMIPMFTSAALAAGSWPSLKSSAYCEFIAENDINVYSNSSCTKRGTSSPSKSYNAYISEGDTCRIIKISSDYLKIQYPTSSGYRTGYIKRSAVLDVSRPTDVITAQAKATTYSSAGGSSYGSIAKGDTVYACGTSGSYTAVIYEAKSGSRAYKLGYVKSSEFSSAAASSNRSSNKNSGNSSNTASHKAGTTEQLVRQRLDDIAEGRLTYNSSTVMTVGDKFKGTRSGEQCKGYAKNAFKLCFDILPGSTKSNDYQLNSTKGMELVADITSISSKKETDLKRLFQQARPGDFVQIRRSGYTPHSAIVYLVSDTGVTFLEANTDGRNTIMLNTHTWNALKKKNDAISIYSASEYVLQ